MWCWFRMQPVRSIKCQTVTTIELSLLMCYWWRTSLGKFCTHICALLRFFYFILSLQTPDLVQHWCSSRNLIHSTDRVPLLIHQTCNFWGTFLWLKTSVKISWVFDWWDVRMSEEGEARSVNSQFAVSVLDQLKLFYEEKLLTDITLLVEDHEFHCHKIILATCSSYFR